MAQTFSQCGRELGFPVADRLMTKHDAADQERRLRYKLSPRDLPEMFHHEGDDVRRILGPVRALSLRSLNCLPQARQRNRR